MAKIIVSASRRTDLPRFHYQWLQQTLQAGRAQIVNPRFPEKAYEVNLQPENVHSIVLWSRDFAGVLANPGYLADYHLYFQYTINRYSKVLEPNVPEYSQSIRILEGLLKRYQPEQFNIRFDPVIISNRGEVCPTSDKPGKARLAVFEILCKDLASLGMKKCRISTSYVAMYGHVRKRLSQTGLDLIPLDDRLQVGFFGRMAEIAGRYDLGLYSCACSILDKVPGIYQGRCIDGQLLEALFGGKVSKAKDQGQRKDCRCHKSLDIGDYNKRCRGGCFYCYAFRKKND